MGRATRPEALRTAPHPPARAEPPRLRPTDGAHTDRQPSPAPLPARRLPPVYQEQTAASPSASGGGRPPVSARDRVFSPAGEATAGTGPGTAQSAPSVPAPISRR